MINLYCPMNKFPVSAFSLQTKEYSSSMTKQGFENRMYDIYSERHFDGNNFFYPFHYRMQWDFDNAVLLGIADTDAFNSEYLEKLRSTPYKNFVVPTEFIRGIFGVPRTKVVPHAISSSLETFSRNRPTITEEHKIPKFYINASHSWHRRGTDIAIKALDEVAKDGYEFEAVLRIWNAGDVQVKRKWLKIVSGFLADDVHYKYLSGADYYLHPVRGGSFEISILEALVLGVTPIITDAPPFNEVPLKRDDVYYISPVHKVTAWQNLWHTGQMWEVDVNNTAVVIEKAFERGKREIDVESYYKKYGVDVISRQLAEIINS